MQCSQTNATAPGVTERSPGSFELLNVIIILIITQFVLICITKVPKLL